VLEGDKQSPGIINRERGRRERERERERKRGREGERVHGHPLSF